MKLTEYLNKGMELSQAATKGPWVAVHDAASFYRSSIVTVHNGRLFDSTSHGKMREDADLVAFSREAVPKLCEALRMAIEHCEACGCGDLEDCDFCVIMARLDKIFGESHE